ncbi:MAG: hypothetical protein A2044_00325 [Candidatus Firestonebacteria bacterium GWA2_43_8]|nr:MAG: hypothetical protein A2044_00325 [Candidatus Firestonebacteria bacterium GWA2_43_8]
MGFADAQTDSLREKTLEVAKRHKASWVELGQYLYAIYKNKHYKSWGYLEFETYVSKELHLRHATAIKLLKSYYFLEKEEPAILEAQNAKEPDEQPLLPNYESVNILRLAKSNKNLAPEDFRTLRKTVFEEGREPRDVRVQARKMITERDDRNPQEIRKSRRNSTIKRLITSLRSSSEELEAGKLLPSYLLKQMEELALKLEDQLE